MFLTMLFKTQNIGQTMHLTMLIAHPYHLSVVNIPVNDEDTRDSFGKSSPCTESHLDHIWHTNNNNINIVHFNDNSDNSVLQIVLAGYIVDKTVSTAALLHGMVTEKLSQKLLQKK